MFSCRTIYLQRSVSLCRRLVECGSLALRGELRRRATALAGHDDTAGEYHLRGYRTIRRQSQQIGQGEAAVSIDRLTLDDATHAQWFVSKLFSDFELSQDNAIRPIETARGPADAIDLAGAGLIVPLLAADSKEVTVVAGPAVAAIEQIGRLAAAMPLRRTALARHPLYLDKWIAIRWAAGIRSTTPSAATPAIRRRACTMDGRFEGHRAVEHRLSDPGPGDQRQSALLVSPGVRPVWRELSARGMAGQPGRFVQSQSIFHHRP